MTKSETVAEIFTDAYKSKGIGLRDAAELLEVGLKTAHRYSTGDSRIPLDLVEKIIEQFEIGHQEGIIFKKACEEEWTQNKRASRAMNERKKAFTKVKKKYSAFVSYGATSSFKGDLDAIVDGLNSFSMNQCEFHAFVILRRNDDANNKGLDQGFMSIDSKEGLLFHPEPLPEHKNGERTSVIKADEEKFILRGKAAIGAYVEYCRFHEIPLLGLIELARRKAEEQSALWDLDNRVAGGRVVSFEDEKSDTDLLKRLKKYLNQSSPTKQEKEDLLFDLSNAIQTREMVNIGSDSRFQLKVGLIKKIKSIFKSLGSA